MTDIDAFTSRQLYDRLLRIRLVEEEIASRYSRGHMRCPTHLSIGQEGVAAGVGLALGSRDQAFSTHRSHAHYLGKGGNLYRMIAELHGKASGCAKGKGGSMHLIDLEVGFQGSTAIVGNSIPLAVGAGLANRIKGSTAVSCAFFGDAAVEEGAFHEALNFAVVKKLPVMFVCENNLYSVYTPLAPRQPAGREIWKFAEAYGVRAIHADGNDTIGVYRVTQTALDYVRSGNGPVFLEFSTYRWLEHCGPNYDNDIGYRTVEEFEEWRQKDPIIRFESDLQKHGLMSVEEQKQVRDAITAEIIAAFRMAEEAPFPEVSEMLTEVYA